MTTADVNTASVAPNAAVTHRCVVRERSSGSSRLAPTIGPPHTAHQPFMLDGMLIGTCAARLTVRSETVVQAGAVSRRHRRVHGA
jgi:hypothetical protein